MFVNSIHLNPERVFGDLQIEFCCLEFVLHTNNQVTFK